MPISLREVYDSDLPVFWEQQSDQVAQKVAAVTRKFHYDRGLFEAHWAKVRANPTITARTVLADDVVAGYAALFGPAGERHVTYWIGRAYWGRGVASAALPALVDLENARPLHASAAADNAASIRVLEKSGFVITGHEMLCQSAR